MVLVFTVLLLLGARTPASADVEGGDLVRFRWAFGAIVGPPDDRRLVAITRDTALKTGDRLKMLIELEKPCYVYLIYQGDDGGLTLLFPYDLKQFDDDYEVSRKYYVPRGNEWFELDEESGLETFFLLASSTRLSDLENRLRACENAVDAERPGLQAQVVEEIRMLRKRHKTFTTEAERPVPIGGRVRGEDIGGSPYIPSIDPIAGEVSAPRFFGRTFTIDHQ